MSHANSATGIASFSIGVPDPGAEIARCEKILDTRASSLADGSARIAMGQADLEMLNPALLQARLGQLACDPAAAQGKGKPRDASMAMVTVRVRDLDAAREGLLRGGFAVGEIGDGTAVAAS